MSLIIRTENGDFDLYENEKIVHTSSIFDIKDISGRSGDYSNSFKLPLTNHNIKLIGYANVLIANTTTIYERISVELIPNGTLFKKGFLSIESIDKDINCRFYSGNSNFYNLLKAINLNELDWSDLDHIWNYTNALYSINNDIDYFYPAIEYNGQTLAGDTVDVRYVLPSTKVSTILNRIFDRLGYSHNLLALDTTLDSMCLPYTNKNPVISSAVLLLNSVDVNRDYDYSETVSDTQWRTIYFTQYPGEALGSFYYNVHTGTNFNQVVTPSSSTYFNFPLQQYTAGYAGNYNYECKIELDNYDTSVITLQTPVGSYNMHLYTYINAYVTTGGNRILIKHILCDTGEKIEPGDGTMAIYTISGLTHSFITDTISGSIGLGVGDILSFELEMNSTISGMHIGSGGPYYTNSSLITDTRNWTVKNTSYLQVDLQPQLIFGGLITYSSMLPKMKCNDFIKDICIREGLILNINEDTKTVTAFKIDDLETNKINAIDWSDKLDETEPPEIKFIVDSYCQNNYFNHATDKTIVNSNAGANYNLSITNANLEKSKVFYTSPFAESESKVFNTINVAYINLYDSAKGAFSIDVTPRILYFDASPVQFKITDGTSTSGLLDIRRVFFIDEDNLLLAMGFGFNQIPNNSQSIVNIIKNLKIVTPKFNININDTNNINYSYPIWVEKYQSYFFLSSINQFYFTSNDLTEVELLKLS